MKKYNMKRKIAAMLCMTMLGSSMTPAAFAEAFLIAPGGDMLSQMLMENSQKKEDVQAEAVQDEVPEVMSLQKKIEDAPVIEKIELKQEIKQEIIPEKKEIKLEALAEIVEPKPVSLVEAIIPEQIVPENVTQAEPPKAETEQQIQQIEKAPEALQPPKTELIEQVPQIQQIQQVQLKAPQLTLLKQDDAPQESYGDAKVTEITKVSAEGKSDGAIKGKVTFTSKRDVVVKLYNGAGEYQTDVSLSHGEGSEVTKTFEFGGLAADTYKIVVWFAGDGYAGLDPRETITDVKVEVKTPEPQAPASEYIDASVYSKDSTDKTTKDGSIEGSVTFKGAVSLIVFAYDENGDEAARKTLSPAEDGGERTVGFSLTDLAAGDYTLRFRFKGDAAAGIDARGTKYVTVRSAKIDPISLSVANDGGKLSATVSGALDREIDIWVVMQGVDAGGNPVKSTVHSTYIIGNGTVQLGTFKDGTYTVYADYVSRGADSQTGDSETVTIAAGNDTTTTPEKPEITTITGSVSNTADSITVSFAADPNFRLYVSIYGKNTAYEAEQELPAGTGSYTFSGLAADTYEIYVDYYDGFGGITPYEPTVTLLGEAASEIKATVTPGDNRIDVTIDSASSLPLVVSVLQNGAAVTAPKTLAAGEKSASFDSLAAGVYDVTIDYSPAQSGTTFTKTGVSVTTKLQAIAITSVKAGENKLTICGTAQPGAQVKVSAEPATADAGMATAATDGTFEVTLVAVAGTTYTKVFAQYAADSNSKVETSGSWTPTAPVTVPNLVLDAIDTNSTTIVGKTTPGVKVQLKTKEGTVMEQRANADGEVRFSLTHTYLKGDTFTITVFYGVNDAQSFTQTLTVGDAAGYGELREGDESDAVLRLTQRLKDLGYPVSATRKYDTFVRDAVKLFQQANGLTASGVADAKTQQVLYSVSAIKYTEKKYPTLVRGDRGLALIYALQQRLKDLGYYTIKVDGIYGSGTQRAVRMFQAVNGLPETGRADHATQVLLYSSSAKPVGYGVSGQFKTLQRSSKYKSAVVPLQRRLRELGYYTGSIDGYFGSKTYRAVRNFQSRNGLKVNGIADPTTQYVLYSSSARRASGSSSSSSSSSSTSVGYRLLYWGCRGDAVTRLQNALISAGYKAYVRKADGVFGQWTYDAVRAYQKDHGLVVDGIAGKNTQNALYGTNY